MHGLQSTNHKTLHQLGEILRDNQTHDSTTKIKRPIKWTIITTSSTQLQASLGTEIISINTR